MAKKFPLTEEAIEGHASDTGMCPYIPTSPSWYAWQAGSYLTGKNLGTPTRARMGRGYSVVIITASGEQKHVVTVKFDSFDKPFFT